MKIAVNTRLLLSRRMEGIARYVYETTRRLVATHPEHEFHFFFDRAYDKQFLFSDNVIPHVLFPPSRHPLLWYAWFEWAVPRKLNEIGADVFYSGDMFLSLKSDTPTLMVSHDLNYEHYPENLGWWARQFYLRYSPLHHKAADHIVSVSQATKADIMKTYGLGEGRISVGHNAVPEGFSPLGELQCKAIRAQYTQGHPYFVFVGSLHPRKNLKRLLVAFDLLKETQSVPHKLVIYGRAAFKNSSLFSTYKKMKHKADVVFLDDIKVTVPEIMGAATALCYVSMFEGFGIPILEAFDCEVPVITSKSSSMPEVAGDAAILVDPLSVNDISKGMAKLLNNPSLGPALVDKGNAQKLKFSWDKTAALIYDNLHKLSEQS